MNYGTKQGHFLGWWKMIFVYLGRWSYGRFKDDNNIFYKMKHDLTNGTWQDDIWCPIIIILLCTSDVQVMSARRMKKLSLVMVAVGIWRWLLAVLVVGKGTDSNFFIEFWHVSVSRLLLCANFCIFFLELNSLPGASTTTKCGTGVVCGVWERPEEMMVVPWDYCWCNVVLAAAKTVLESQSYCFSDAAVPCSLGEGCNWLWLGGCWFC